MVKYCKECGKELIKGQKKFCCQSCAAKYNNRMRLTTTKGKTKKTICIRCGKEFFASIHINKCKCICPECKIHNRPHYKNKKDIVTLLDLSKRTFMKILKRMNVGCALCGWKESSCDVHHIIPKKHGGTDDFNNLIVICPNCHRICHTTNKYTIDYLQKYNFLNLYPNWKDFYYISN